MVARVEIPKAQLDFCYHMLSVLHLVTQVRAPGVCQLQRICTNMAARYCMGGTYIHTSMDWIEYSSSEQPFNAQLF